MLPFSTTHLFLAGTRSVVNANAGLKISAPAPNTTRTNEEKLAIARRVVSALFDPHWINTNPERFDYVLRRATTWN